jgi:hypothetical protein
MSAYASHAARRPDSPRRQWNFTVRDAAIAIRRRFGLVRRRRRSRFIA